MLGEWGIPRDSLAGRKQFGRRLEERREHETQKTDWRCVQRGWCLGDKAFREELLARMQERGDHYGPELREADALHAERVVQEELRRRRWTKLDLTQRRKGDPEKVAIARRLRRESAMSLKWIAERLQMGTWTYVSNCVVQQRRTLATQNKSLSGAGLFLTR